MFYIVAIIGVLYLLASRGSSVTSSPQVLTQQQPQNNVTPAIPGAAMYFPTANGQPGRVVVGPTGVYGTLGVSQSGISDGIATITPPAQVIFDPVQPIVGVIDYRRQQGTLPQLGAPDMVPAGKSVY